MAKFNSYEELMAHVAESRQAVLTLEVEVGAPYSVEYEEAKAELRQAEAMQTITGGGFLGDNLEQLKQRVAETKPESMSVWVQYKKLDLDEWAALMKQNQAGPVDQYERVLAKTFIGVYAEDPLAEDEHGILINEGIEPLTTNPLSVSTKGGSATILPGGALHSVVQNFMSWQNSGGEVSIRPTKSGRV